MRLLTPTPPSYVGWPAEELTDSVADRFEQMVYRYPARLALQDSDCTLTYEQLNRAVNRLARAILGAHGQQPTPVVLYFGLEADVIIAMLAVLKTGKFYVPLDLGYPPPRTAEMMADCGATLVLTNSQHAERARDIFANTITILEIDTVDQCFADDNLNLAIPADALLNITYTSGSTGKPKGVMQTQRNVVHDTRSTTEILKICPHDRFGLIMPVTFGASISDICGPLLNGAAVCTFDLKQGTMRELDEWVRNAAITVIHCVPTVFRQWMNNLHAEVTYPAMRIVKLGGESLLYHDFRLFRQHFGNECILRNALGTTETYMVTCYLMNGASTVDKTVLPVGYATHGREVLILDEERRPLPAAEVGEIAVRSPVLFPGYWQQPELTASVLLPDRDGGDARIYLTGDLGCMDHDGCVEHLGRKDDMVKIRGQRVELEAVEMALLNLPSVAETVVVAQQTPGGDYRLVAYIVPATNPPPTVSSLRTALVASLAEHMIPSAYVMMESFPLLPFGKVNRRALPAPDASRPDLSIAYAAPETPVQAQLALLVGDVLKLNQIGIHDNFFDLGGDSLLATQLVARIAAEFQTKVTLTDLFDDPTVAALAVRIISAQIDQLADDDLAALLAELDELSDEEAESLVTG